MWLDNPVIDLSKILGASPIPSRIEQVRESDDDDVQELGTNLKVYNARWVTLALIGGPYFLSSCASYTVATDGPDLDSYFDVDDSTLTDVFAYFLLGNVIGTLVEPYCEWAFGLRKLFIFSAILLVLGITCSVADRSIFFWEIIGMAIFGICQGIVQCPVAKVCAIWFSTNGRTLATSFALNMNNFGIGCAYIVPGLFWSDGNGFTWYRGSFLMVSVIFLFLTILFMEERPPHAPSISAEMMHRETQQPQPQVSNPLRFTVDYWISAFSLLKVDGFFSILSINIGVVVVGYMSTVYLSETLEADYSDSATARTFVGMGYYIPTIFITSGAAGLLDHFKTQNARGAYLVSLHGGCIIAIVCCVMIMIALICAPEDSARDTFIVFMIILGILMGVLDGLSADAAVEVCYGSRCDNGHGVENMVVTLQMLFGNVFTGLMMVGISSSYMKHWMSPDYMAIYVITTLMAILMYVPMFGFTGKFKRVTTDLRGKDNVSTVKNGNNDEKAYLCELTEDYQPQYSA